MPVGGDDDTLANAPTGERSQAAAASGGWDDRELVAGRYRIVRWLGAGGMGRVYEALDTELDERVALKVLRGGLSDEAIERFRREVKLTRRIQHRNVARMFDIGEHRSDKFLTMELIDGAALTRELGAPIPWPRLKQLAIQLCAGLGAAHDAGVIHRDLKPDNVMIERGTDRVVITDFGIARSGDDVGVTQVGALIGTPRYMAPEQLAGDDVDHRADLFALGVMLYELATGVRPWSGDTAIAIAVAQATQPARPLAAAQLPPALAAAIVRCIALDPARRPPSAAVIGAALASAGSGPVAMPPPGAAAGDPGDPDDADAARTRKLLAAARTTLPGIGPALAPTWAEAAAPTTLSVARTAIAVLPVACAPGDEDLADGLLDDLVDTLSSTGTLRVRPAGVVRSRGEIDPREPRPREPRPQEPGAREPGPRELGRALAVDHVVASSVRRTPAGLRITARLIGVADGFQIWAHREDCGEAEILAAAERIGRGVATALSARAAAAERPTDPRAVELYLRARAELRRFWGEHVQNAADLLEEAAALAPGSPPILGAAAFAAVQAWIMRGEPELLPRAYHAIERGLAGGHGEAFLAASTLRLNQGDLEGAATALGTALVRAPMSAQAHETAGRILMEIDAAAEGRRHLEIALALDPGRAGVIGGELGRLDALEGDWDSAMARCRRLLADPDSAVALIGASLEARLSGWRRDREGTTAAATRMAPRIGQAAHLLAFFHQASRAGAIDLAQWNVLEQMFTRRDRPGRMQVISLQLMAELSLILGYRDLAMRALGKATDAGLIDTTWLGACPLFVDVAGDLGYQAIREAIARRASGVLAAFRAATG
jgi:serine/threonine-protein kinase